MLVVACLLLVLTVAAGASPAPGKRADACTWGASSIVVEQVKGRYVQSEAETMGCIP